MERFIFALLLVIAVVSVSACYVAPTGHYRPVRVVEVHERRERSRH
jgi:hypothetical protein